MASTGIFEEEFEMITSQFSTTTGSSFFHYPQRVLYTDKLQGGALLHRGGGGSEKPEKVLNEIKMAAVPLAIKDGADIAIDKKAKELEGLGFVRLAKRVQAKSDEIVKTLLIQSAGYKIISVEKVKEYVKKLLLGTKSW